MSFLAPAALWALALALPVAALYLLRERVRRLPVSNIVLWSGPSRRVRESRGWKRLRHPVSLALQLLLLTLLVLALARPRIGAAGGPLVLVLDRSASMGATDAGGSRLEAAARALAALLHSGSPPHTLITTGSPPEMLVPRSTDAVGTRRLLLAQKPAEAPHNPAPALAMARALAAARGGRVVFATDGVGSACTENEAFSGVETILVGSPHPANAGLAAFAASRAAADPAGVTVLAGYATSTRGPGNSTLRILADGKPIEVREMEGSGPWFQQWTLRAPGGLSLEARLEPPDVLAADNHASLKLPPAHKLRVVVVSPPSRALERVFEAMPGIEAARVWPPESLVYGDPGAVYVFHGALPPADFQAAGMLLIEPAVGGFFGRRTGGPLPMAPDFADPSSPAARHLRVERLEPLPAAEFDPAPTARTDLASAGRPLIFSHWSGKPRWTVLAFDPSKPAFSESPAYPVLMANLVEGLAGAPQEALHAPGLELSLTRLERKKVEAGAGGGDGVRPGAPSPPDPVRWLLLLALVWAVGEAWTYHRRITV